VAVNIKNPPAKAKPAEQVAAAGKEKKSRKRITNNAYPDSVFERILDYVAAGETLAEACRRRGMPNPVTVRRRLEADEQLHARFHRAGGIKLRGMVEHAQGAGARAIAEAERKGTKVTAADRVAAARLDTDTVKWAAQKLLSEYQALEDGGGTVTLNIVGAPDAQSVPGAPATPYIPPGKPVLKIVGAMAQDEQQQPQGQGNG